MVYHSICLKITVPQYCWISIVFSCFGRHMHVPMFCNLDPRFWHYIHKAILYIVLLVNVLEPLIRWVTFSGCSLNLWVYIGCVYTWVYRYKFLVFLLDSIGKPYLYLFPYSIHQTTNIRWALSRVGSLLLCRRWSLRILGPTYMVI